MRDIEWQSKYEKTQNWYNDRDKFMVLIRNEFIKNRHERKVLIDREVGRAIREDTKNSRQASAGGIYEVEARERNSGRRSNKDPIEVSGPVKYSESRTLLQDGPDTISIYRGYNPPTKNESNYKIIYKIYYEI
jgi:hypothetical protein